MEAEREAGPTFSVTGVKLSYFRDFIETCGGTAALTGLTTTDVCEKFVKPVTAGSGVSMCEHLAMTVGDVVGPADWFISHAWKFQFLDVVEAVTLFFESTGLAADGVTPV
jgi:hypothetical protein